ncbi:hypothetical protein C0995_014167 [Termitomyces sp. Mi166|nr:hypothetical protein C0995_014167 [Termitomyces sp. Mi166\
MRGELCVSTATLLSLAAVLLMIFVHVGQINTSTVPRNIAMARVNVSQYSSALELSFTDPFNSIYATNASAPLGVQAGLRYFYNFGLYSHCAYLNDSQGICGNMTVGRQYRPYDAITSDMAANYSRITQALVQGTTFMDSSYLGNATKAAYWMLLLGTVCALLAALIGFSKSHFSFFFSTIFAVAGSILLLIGTSIWTIMIKKSDAVNDLLIGDQADAVPIGIIVTLGSGLYLSWAALVSAALGKDNADMLQPMPAIDNEKNEREIFI